MSNKGMKDYILAVAGTQDVGQCARQGRPSLCEQQPSQPEEKLLVYATDAKHAM